MQKPWRSSAEREPIGCRGICGRIFIKMIRRKFLLLIIINIQIIKLNLCTKYVYNITTCIAKPHGIRQGVKGV